MPLAMVSRFEASTAQAAAALAHSKSAQTERIFSALVISFESSPQAGSHITREGAVAIQLALAAAGAK